MANDHHITTDSNSYEKVKTFKYLGSLLIIQNSIHKEIKCRPKAGNSSYYSVQTFLSSWLLFKNFKNKIYKTIKSPVVLYVCETWSHTLLVFEKQNSELNIWAQEGWEWEWRRLQNAELHSLYYLPNIVRMIKYRRLRWVRHVARM